MFFGTLVQSLLDFVLMLLFFKASFTIWGIVSTFCSLWGTFWVHFFTLGVIFKPFGGMLWFFETRLWTKGVPGAPEGAHSRSKQTLWGPFGDGL